MALFTFIADDIAPLKLPNKPLGFVVTGIIRSGKIYLGDDVIFVMPNHIVTGEVFGIEKEGHSVSWASPGDAVGLAFVGIPKENFKDAVQSDDDYGITWLSLGIISASAPIVDETAIDELRRALPNPRLIIEEKRAQIIETTQTHIAVLLQKYDQLTYIDEYDSLEVGDFEKEIGRFIKKKLPEIQESFAKPIITDIVRKSCADREVRDRAFEKNMNPFEYENFCADQLSRSGWVAKVTKRSGDQGGDIIAEKEGRRIVIQCKLYNQPVGNKAVQEVFAAREFHRAYAAYVVSNSTFTKSAYQLASSLKVALIHHEQLNDIQ